MSARAIPKEMLVSCRDLIMRSRLQQHTGKRTCSISISSILFAEMASSSATVFLTADPPAGLAGDPPALPPRACGGEGPRSPRPSQPEPSTSGGGLKCTALRPGDHVWLYPALGRTRDPVAGLCLRCNQSQRLISPLQPMLQPMLQPITKMNQSAATITNSS